VVASIPKIETSLSIVTSAWYDYLWLMAIKPAFSKGLLLLPVNLSDDSLPPTPAPDEELSQESASPTTAGSSMQEYYQLKRNLLVITLAMTGVIFISVWIFYSIDIALNYLIGACTGMIYLRMLAKEVERLGQQKRRPSSTRLALLIGVFVVASQWQKLQILPIFLGFLTYKAALIAYVLQSTLLPPSSNK
jgi:ATP synthase protein I